MKKKCSKQNNLSRKRSIIDTASKHLNLNVNTFNMFLIENKNLILIFVNFKLM